MQNQQQDQAQIPPGFYELYGEEAFERRAMAKQVRAQSQEIRRLQGQIDVLLAEKKESAEAKKTDGGADEDR